MNPFTIFDQEEVRLWPGDPSHRVAHCIASCRVSREVPFGGPLSYAAGRVLDPPFLDKATWPYRSEAGDRHADDIGLKCATINVNGPNQSCQEQCLNYHKRNEFYKEYPSP